MATQEEINDQTGTALTAGERDRVREILEIEGTATNSEYTDLDDRIDALAAEQNQRLKAHIFVDWDAIAAEPAQLEGGTDGVKYDSDKHELKVRNKVRILLGYPKLGRAAGGIYRIPVVGSSYGHGCPVEEDLY